MDKVLPGHEQTVKSIWFSYNKITFIENGTFDKFTALEVLYLSNQNILSTTNFTFPIALKNLKTLSLSSCNISHLDDNIFINLRSLGTISLASNPLTVIPIALNALSQSLQSLNLNSVDITALKNTKLNHFNNLTSISMTSSNLERIEDCAFCNFPNLKSVSILYSRRLSYIHENAFGGVTNENPIQLEKFDIENCNISTFSEKLLDWKNITSIDISRNPLSCNCSMAWLINDYKSTTPLYVNNIKWAGCFVKYCVGKAAREAYFRNFALETDSRVLNYSPGPVETDMITEIGKSSFDPQIREMFSPTSTQSVDTHRKRLSPKETVSKLIAIIDKNEFDNGGRVDYFDS
uniref:Uncharacterized protein n=1 Tax=Panagrolaimus sp. PS1159 TaxID=55785 RepID=A0AC35FLC0_9BILA